jgi:hypothetical protein
MQITTGCLANKRMQLTAHRVRRGRYAALCRSAFEAEGLNRVMRQWPRLLRLLGPGFHTMAGSHG